MARTRKTSSAATVRAAPIPNAPPQPSPRDQTRALFRAAVLQAAEQVFAEKGFHGARIQDVAARARVAVGTVYNYFQEKEELLEALLREQGDQVARAYQARPDDPEDFEGRFRARNKRVIAFLEEHRSFFAVAANHGLFDVERGGVPVRAGALPCTLSHLPNQTDLLLREGIEQGALRPADPTRLQRFLGGAMRATLLGALRDNTSNLQQEGEFAIDLFLRAARAELPKRKTRKA